MRVDLEPARSGLGALAGGIANGTACRRASEPQRPSSEMAVGGCTRCPRLRGRWTQCRRIHSSRRRTLYIVDWIWEGSRRQSAVAATGLTGAAHVRQRCPKLSPSKISRYLEQAKRALDDGCLSNGAVRTIQREEAGVCATPF